MSLNPDLSAAAAQWHRCPLTVIKGQYRRLQSSLFANKQHDLILTSSCIGVMTIIVEWDRKLKYTERTK